MCFLPPVELQLPLHMAEYWNNWPQCCKHCGELEGPLLHTISETGAAHHNHWAGKKIKPDIYVVAAGKPLGKPATTGSIQWEWINWESYNQLSQAGPHISKIQTSQISVYWTSESKKSVPYHKQPWESSREKAIFIFGLTSLNGGGPAYPFEDLRKGPSMETVLYVIFFQ